MGRTDRFDGGQVCLPVYTADHGFGDRFDPDQFRRSGDATDNEGLFNKRSRERERFPSGSAKQASDLWRELLGAGGELNTENAILQGKVFFNGIFGEGVLSHFGLKQGDAASATVRGALQDFDNSVTPVEFQMTGSIIAVERSPLGNEQAQETVTMSLTYYKETIGSDTPVEIDVLNQRRVIDGEDQLEAIRNAIGA